MPWSFLVLWMTVPWYFLVLWSSLVPRFEIATARLKERKQLDEASVPWLGIATARL